MPSPRGRGEDAIPLYFNKPMSTSLASCLRVTIFLERRLRRFIPCS
jgi:hypothetical protein